MMRVERITLIVKLNLKLQCWTQVYVLYTFKSYIHASGTISIDVEQAGDNAKWLDERDRGVIFKNWAPFTDGLGEVNNTQIDNAKDLYAAILMYSLIKYRENYSKTSGSLWQYYRVDPNDILTNSESFKFNINR